MAFRILCITDTSDWIDVLDQELSNDQTNYEFENLASILQKPKAENNFNLIILDKDSADKLPPMNLATLPPIIKLQPTDKNGNGNNPKTARSHFSLTKNNTDDLLKVIKQCVNLELQHSFDPWHQFDPKQGYLKISASGEIIYADEAICTILGHSSSQLVGMNFFDSYLSVRTAIQSFLQIESVIQRKDDSIFFALINLMPNKAESGEILDIGVVIRTYDKEKADIVGKSILEKVDRTLCNEEECAIKAFKLMVSELKQHLPEETQLEILFDDQHAFFDNQNTFMEDQTWNNSFSMPDSSNLPISITHKLSDTPSNKQFGPTPFASKNPPYLKARDQNNTNYHHWNLLDKKGVAYGHIVVYSFGKTAAPLVYYKHLIQYVCLNFEPIAARIKSNQNNAKILNLSEDLICIVNKKGIVSYANPAFLVKLGVTPKSVVGKPVYDLFHPDEKISPEFLIRMLNSGKQRFKLETRMITTGSFVRHVSWTAISSKSDDSFYCIGHDFTEKRIYQDKIKNSEIRYRGLFEGMSEGLIESDPEGTIMLVNPGLCEMLGYEENELIGQNQYKLLHDSTTSARLQSKMKYRKLGKVGRYEAIFLDKNGTKVWTEVSTTPIFDSKNKFVGIISIVLNITQRKNAEQQTFKIKEAFTKALESQVVERTRELEFARNELAISLKKEQYLSKLKSRFVSMASHQFRTPLSIILSNLGVLSMYLEDLDMEQKKDVTKLHDKFDTIHLRIQQQVKKMTDLMNDVLILGNINDGNIKRRIVKQCLVQVCEDLILGYNGLDETQQFEFEVIGEPFDLDFDKQLMEHALSNLMSNAMKYSFPQTSPKLKLKFDPEAVQITVKNQGIGIPKDEIEFIFDPFFRASNAKTYQGTGLGTSIVKEYLEYMNATIEVTSEIDKDTIFIITFNI